MLTRNSISRNASLVTTSRPSDGLIIYLLSMSVKTHESIWLILSESLLTKLANLAAHSPLFAICSISLFMVLPQMILSWRKRLSRDGINGWFKQWFAGNRPNQASCNDAPGSRKRLRVFFKTTSIAAMTGSDYCRVAMVAKTAKCAKRPSTKQLITVFLFFQRILIFIRACCWCSWWMLSRRAWQEQHEC